jgi:hypothetical protein
MLAIAFCEFLAANRANARTIRLAEQFSRGCHYDILPDSLIQIKDVVLVDGKFVGGYILM